MFCIQGYSRQCKNCKLIEAKTIHGQAVTFCYIWGKTLMNEKKPRTALGLMGRERHRWLRFVFLSTIIRDLNPKTKEKKWGQDWGWLDGSGIGDYVFEAIVQNDPKTNKKRKKNWGQGWGWWDGSTAAARAITFSTQLGQSQPCKQLGLSPSSQRWGVSKNISLQTICCENKKDELPLIRTRSGPICHYLYIYFFYSVQQNRQLSHLDIVGRWSLTSLLFLQDFPSEMRGIRSSLSTSKSHFVQQSASSTILHIGLQFYKFYNSTILHVGLPADHLLIGILIAAVVVVRALVRDEEGGDEGEEAQARQGQEEPKKPGRTV